MLDSDQVESIKKKIIEQIDKSFPEDKKEFAKNQVSSMDSEQLEKFLNQNKLVGSNKKSSECVFCSIISEDIQSFKIDENSKALAVLEINPYSRGHTIIIPKDHISSEDKLSPDILSLAEKVSKKIKTNLKPESVKIDSSNLFGHEIINVIPVYIGETPSERTPITKEELSSLKEIITKKTENANKKTIVQKVKKKPQQKEKITLPKRIP